MSYVSEDTINGIYKRIIFYDVVTGDTLHTLELGNPYSEDKIKIFKQDIIHKLTRKISPQRIKIIE